MNSGLEINAFQGSAVASLLMANNFDPSILRPYVGSDGRTYFNQNGKSVLMNNAPSLLRKDEWIELDTAVLRVAKPMMRLYGDVRSLGLTYSLRNGMGTTVLEHQTISDVAPAEVSMDGLRQTKGDRPVYDLEGLPLPIISHDFEISARQLATSRNRGNGVDTTYAELAARRVAEAVEEFMVGTRTFSFGGYNIYGYSNYPKRLTKTITAPTAGGWTPATTYDEIVGMMQQSVDNNFTGPWRLYYSRSFMQYMMKRYSADEPRSLLRMLQDIPRITSVEQADYLSTGFRLLLVQMSSDVVRVVNGMEMTTLQWAEQGGLNLRYKVMTIMVPQLRCDQNDQTGIVDGAPA